jgi:hypothetical protein
LAGGRFRGSFVNSLAGSDYFRRNHGLTADFHQENPVDCVLLRLKITSAKPMTECTFSRTFKRGTRRRGRN